MAKPQAEPVYHFVRMAAADQSFDHFYATYSELSADFVELCQPKSFASKHGLTTGIHVTKIILCVRHGGAEGAAEGKPAGHC